MSEFTPIRRVKYQGVAQVNGKEIKISKEVFNSKRRAVLTCRTMGFSIENVMYPKFIDMYTKKNYVKLF